MQECRPDVTIPQAQSLLVVLSGPSGVGKDAVLSRMKQLDRPYYFTVTATTRPQRAGERDGVDYIFVSHQEFQRMVQGNELLEWARVYGHCYGVPKGQVKKALEQGKDVIIKADVQGAATIRVIAPQALLIFLAPPNMGELKRRIRERMTESAKALELRIRTAQEEMKQVPLFDYMVVNYNDRLDQAVADIDAIIIAEKHRLPPRMVAL